MLLSNKMQLWATISWYMNYFQVSLSINRKCWKTNRGRCCVGSYTHYQAPTVRILRPAVVSPLKVLVPSAASLLVFKYWWQRGLIGYWWLIVFSGVWLPGNMTLINDHHCGLSYQLLLHLRAFAEFILRCGTTRWADVSFIQHQQAEDTTQCSELPYRCADVPGCVGLHFDGQEVEILVYFFNKESSKHQFGQVTLSPHVVYLRLNLWPPSLIMIPYMFPRRQGACSSCFSTAGPSTFSFHYQQSETQLHLCPTNRSLLTLLQCTAPYKNTCNDATTCKAPPLSCAWPLRKCVYVCVCMWGS